MLKLILLNIQLPAEVTFLNIDEKIREMISQTDCLLLLGDFQEIASQVNHQKKDVGGLKSVVPLNLNTGCPGVKQRYSDNILLTSAAQSKLTGIWGIVKQGLTHLAIPNGWSWGGLASPHCPLWIELYVNSNQNGTVLWYNEFACKKDNISISKCFKLAII